MNDKPNSTSIYPYQIVAKVLKYSFLFLVTVLITGGSLSAFNNFQAKNKQVAPLLHAAAFDYLNANHTLPNQLITTSGFSAIGLDNAEDDLIDEDINEDYCSKLTKGFRDVVIHAELNRIVSANATAADSHTAIPFFILYHSWKGFLS